jgi:hypothetical protein
MRIRCNRTEMAEFIESTIAGWNDGRAVSTFSTGKRPGVDGSEPRPAHYRRLGMEVRVERTPLGGYMLSTDSGRATRVRRRADNSGGSDLQSDVCGSDLQSRSRSKTAPTERGVCWDCDPTGALLPQAHRSHRLVAPTGSAAIPPAGPAPPRLPPACQARPGRQPEMPSGRAGSADLRCRRICGRRS